MFAFRCLFTWVIHLLAISSFIAWNSPVSSAENSLLDKMEAGQIISSRVGDSIQLQMLSKLELVKIRAALSDLKNLPKLFPSEIAFVRLFKTSESPARNLVYLKVRGLGDGTSLLMEVKRGLGDSFENAMSLINTAGYRPNENVEEKKPELELLKLAGHKNLETENKRSLSVDESIVLEGPLNELAEFPTLRFSITLGTGNYFVTKGDPILLKIPAAVVLPKLQIPAFQFPKVLPSKSVAATTRPSVPAVNAPIPVGATPSNLVSNQSYIVAEISFSSQSSRSGSMGDIQGFGDQRLQIAEYLAMGIMQSFRKNLSAF